MQEFEFTHHAMETHWAIRMYGEERPPLASMAQECFNMLDNLENRLSRFRHISPVHRINTLKKGESVMVPLETFECLRLAFELSQMTGGAFDANVGHYVRCYRDDENKRLKPGDQDIERAREQTSGGQLGLDPDNFRVTCIEEGAFIDLGGIGKGYALDQMAKLLRDWECGPAMLHGGTSTILALDPPPGEPGWDLGVGEGEGVETVIANRALSCSGPSSERGYIIDPRSGEHIGGDRGWTWVLAPSGAWADALSTAFLLFDEEEMAEFCEAHPEVAAVAYMPDGEGGRAPRKFGSWPG